MSRRLVVTENMTVDGRIEMLDDWFDPQGPSDPAALDEQRDLERQLRESSDAVLVGRVTFEAFRGYWRDLADDPTGVAAHLNGVEKLVVSSTLGDPEWAGTTILRGDPLDEAARLKDGHGGDIVATGSITLVQALVAGHLVDEYRLFTYPAAQGRGKGLFDGTEGPVHLELVEAVALRTGLTFARYLPV